MFLLVTAYFYCGRMLLGFMATWNLGQGVMRMGQIKKPQILLFLLILSYIVGLLLPRLLQSFLFSRILKKLITAFASVIIFMKEFWGSPVSHSCY